MTLIQFANSPTTIDFQAFAINAYFRCKIYVKYGYEKKALLNIFLQEMLEYATLQNQNIHFQYTGFT